jgi:putative tricarboxylic transport membrane protein
MAPLLLVLVLVLVLGPLFEKALVQSSAIGQGNLFVLFPHPISGILIFAVLLAAGPAVTRKIVARRRANQPQNEEKAPVAHQRPVLEAPDPSGSGASSLPGRDVRED